MIDSPDRKAMDARIALIIAAINAQTERLYEDISAEEAENAR